MIEEGKEQLPKNSVRGRRSVHIEEQARGQQAEEAEQPRVEQVERTSVTARSKCALSPISVAYIPEHTEAKNGDDEFNYISDDEDDVQKQRTLRRSKRVLQQLRDNEKNGLHLIVAFVANKTANVPDQVVKTNKLANCMANTNLNLYK